MTRPRNSDLYLDLLCRALTGELYEDPPIDPWHGVVYDESGKVVKFGEAGGVLTVEEGRYDAEQRRLGLDWPMCAETMIGLDRLHQLCEAVHTVLGDKVPGDLLEAGVWRGGASILMRAMLEVYDDDDRRVWFADSFEGLPKPESAVDAGDVHSIYAQLAVRDAEVIANFKRYGLWDEQVVLLRGWFKDTLPKAPIGALALLHIDVDMYDSTKQCLEHLYPKLSPGGICIIDDYYAFPTCRQAVDEYRAANGINEPIYARYGDLSVSWTKLQP